MDNDTRAKSLRNKDNYLRAKAAFNEGDMATCMSYYALDHQIRSRDVPPGREQIEAFLSGMRKSWPNLSIIVDNALADEDWVAGRCTSTATHSETVMGVAPTGRTIQASFWDMHRFNNDGLIVESWNILDSLAILQQLGLMPSGG